MAIITIEKDTTPEDEIKTYTVPENADKDYESEFWEDAEETSPRSTVLLRTIALITAMALLGLIAFNAWPNFKYPLVDLVQKSLQLKKDVDLNLMQAVVQISVLSRRQGSSVAVEQKTGTGFNISPDGVIVTNHHVVEDALNMVITFPDGKTYKAEHWLGNPESDLAVIALRVAGLPVMPVNQVKLPVSGDKILVVGNPLSLHNIVVEGRVGGYLKVVAKQGKIFSIDAPIYPGNSGSPVLNQNGQVVGVVFGSMKVEVDGMEKVNGLAVTIDEAAGLISAVNTGQKQE